MTPLTHRDFGGTGEIPLVILHGLLGSSRNWQAVASDLAATRRVLAVDFSVSRSAVVDSSVSQPSPVPTALAASPWAPLLAVLYVAWSLVQSRPLDYSILLLFALLCTTCIAYAVRLQKRRGMQVRL